MRCRLRSAWYISIHACMQVGSKRRALHSKARSKEDSILLGDLADKRQLSFQASLAGSQEIEVC